VPPARVDDVREVLEEANRKGAGEGFRFAEVEGVHIARLVLVPQGSDSAGALLPASVVYMRRLPRQDFGATQQFAVADRLSFNPWHALPEHRPLGNQNRARRAIYLRLSGLGQSNERHTARGPW
jgi:hypothetical protein